MVRQNQAIIRAIFERVMDKQLDEKGESWVENEMAEATEQNG